MRKLYFITSIPATAKDGIITGVVANGQGRAATARECDELIAFLRENGATTSLIDSLLDDAYRTPSVFDRRADARNEAAVLNSYGSLFNFSVQSVGESIRKPVHKPLGWRFMYNGGEVSAHNDHYLATVRIDGNLENDSEYNMLFPTREVARKVFAENELAGEDWTKYTIEAYYA